MSSDASTNAPAVIRTSKPGRKPKPAAADKIATLEAQLAAAKAEAKEAAKARATIVGLAVVDAMKDDPALAKQIASLLRTRVKGTRDRAAIAELLL